jgi:hypothetical protein
MNPNDPAFPLADEDMRTFGLTKLEYFAGLALQGYLARDWDAGGGSLHTIHAERAKASVQQAKALIAELAKEPK